jgi:hypothetical protein
MSDGTEGQENRARIKDRFQRDWGLELPESIFRFWAFHQSLGPVERQALGDLWIGPDGIMDLFADPDARPRDGVDIRVHGRYYRDPPEFVTFMHGNTDGLHYGLWFDDGRVCSGVASYYNNDGGGIDISAGTPLEAVRAFLERVWSDVDDEVAGYDNGSDLYEEVAAKRARLDLLRERLTEFETGDRAEVGRAYSHRYMPRFVPPVRPDRVTTLDEAGALVTGETALDRPAHDGADTHKFATYMYGLFEDSAAVAASVDDALRRCAAGDPAEALVLGRDLHWASVGDPTREAYANDLLVMAYRALGRPSLADIVDAHHRHRSLPTVDVLESSSD